MLFQRRKNGENLWNHLEWCQRMLDILAISGSVKAQEEVWIWKETNSIEWAHYLSRPVFIKLKREGRMQERREEFVGWISQEKASMRMERTGGEEHKPGERKQPRHRRKWASGGYLRVTGCCHDCTVLWVNCQNIDWSTWQPSPFPFLFKVLCSVFVAAPQKENFQHWAVWQMETKIRECKSKNGISCL